MKRRREIYIDDATAEQFRIFAESARNTSPRKPTKAESTPKQVSDAYKSLARLLHPDVGGSEEAMRNLNILMEATKR
jgi:hypothetical protein